MRTVPRQPGAMAPVGFAVFCRACPAWAPLVAPTTQRRHAEARRAGWVFAGHAGWCCPTCRIRAPRVDRVEVVRVGSAKAKLLAWVTSRRAPTYLVECPGYDRATTPRVARALVERGFLTVRADECGDPIVGATPTGRAAARQLADGMNALNPSQRGRVVRPDAPSPSVAPAAADPVSPVNRRA